MTIPVHVLSGFLGAGKTTLLNHLLRDPRMSNSGVLVNEIGPVGIDHDLVLGGTDDMLLLDGGCLCCQPSGSVADGINRLVTAAEQPPERLIVELSGAANPVPILEILGMTPVLRDRVHLAGVLTVIDATAGTSILERHPEARLQAACADRLAVSKLDLARQERRPSRLGPALAGINAGAPRHVLHEGAPGPELLDALASGQRPVTGPTLRPLPATASNHAEAFETVALEFDGDLEAEDVQEWIGEVLDAYGHNLLRIKGLLHLAGKERPAVLQCVRDLVHPIRFTESVDDKGPNRIVAIGWNIHPDLLQRTLEHLASRARPQAT